MFLVVSISNRFSTVYRSCGVILTLDHLKAQRASTNIKHFSIFAHRATTTNFGPHLLPQFDIVKVIRFWAYPK